MWKQFRAAVTVLLLMTLLTGVLYPLAVTAVAIGFFPHQAEGSLIKNNGRIVGSELIGQQFDGPKYFWGRPSATQPHYNAGSSCGTNYGPMNPSLAKSVKTRIDKLHRTDVENSAPIPVDLVTASGSGLDPHISVAAALYQVRRVAIARKMETAKVKNLVLQQVEERQFGVFGEKRVNVLKLNILLDDINRIE